MHPKGRREGWGLAWCWEGNGWRWADSAKRNKPMAHHCDSFTSQDFPERLKGYLAFVHFFCIIAEQLTCSFSCSIPLATALQKSMLCHQKLVDKAPPHSFLTCEMLSTVCFSGWEPSGTWYERCWNIFWAERQGNRKKIKIKNENFAPTTHFGCQKGMSTWHHAALRGALPSTYKQSAYLKQSSCISK